MWPDPPKHSDAMNIQLMTLGASRVKMKGLQPDTRTGLSTRYEHCAMSMAIPINYAPSAELSLPNQPRQRGVPLDYIPPSFSEIQLLHARRQMLVQEDSKMAEFIDRVSQVSLIKT